MTDPHRHSDPSDPAVTLSVVVPVYNSVESLPELVERLCSVIEGSLGVDFEIIMVDDGSPNPKTWPTLAELAAQTPQLRVFQLTRNFGKHGAVMCGFNQVRGRWVATLDDDLQHRPEDLPRLWESRDHDVVIGAYERKRHSLFKRVTSKIKGYFDFRIAGKPRHVAITPYKLIKRGIVDAMTEIRAPVPMIAAMLGFVTRDMVNVTIQHDARKFGRSEYTLRKMVGQFSVLVLNNSGLVINAVVLIGIAVSIISFGFAIYVVGKTLIVGVEVPGWASIMVVISILGGLILLTLGVIGEYLLRILNGAENRPSYIVRQSNEAP